MGTTLTALQSDAGISTVYVVAIEGYGVLLTSGSPSATVTAWAATDWTECVGGLSVSGKLGQNLDPWRPFGEPAEIQLSVVPCPGQTAGTDRFAEDAWNRTGGVSSDLVGEIAAGETAIAVLSEANFDASGTIYIDNEAITYSSVGSNVFAVSASGVWTPFRTESDAGLSRSHGRTGTTVPGVNTAPEVTSVPRQMVGRGVEVWIHRRLGTVLDTKAQAHRAFAGRIKEIQETEAGTTVLTCEDIKGWIAETVILREQYKARVKEGIFLPVGTAFNTLTTKDTPASEQMNPLVVIASGASTANEIDSGIYTVQEIASRINAWFASEFGAGRSLFNLGYAAFVTTDDGLRPRLTYDDPTSGAAERRATINCTNNRVARYLGWPGGIVAHYNTQSGVAYGSEAPMRVLLMQHFSQDVFQVDVENAQGTWATQGDLLPLSLNDGTNEGILKIGDKGMVVAFQNGTGSFFYRALGPEWGSLTDTVAIGGVCLTVEEEGDLEVTQSLLLEETFATVLRRMLSSTGTPGFNNTHDVLRETISCGIPHSLMDTLIDTDLVSVDHAALRITVVVDKPTKFEELFAADFIMRKCFLVWKAGELRLTSWQTPTADYATVALTESNKAAPVGARDKMRASVTESDAWMRNIVKLQYGRRPDGAYAYTTNLEDAVSVRRYGAKPVTIELRNMPSGQVLSNLEGLIGQFTEWMPVLSRPQIRVRRTIARTLFETAVAGAQATITDEHVRDWATGQRGITGRPGLVAGHWFDWGGAEHGEDGPPRVTPPQGEVELLIYPTNTAVYAPAALVDDTATNAGYNDATKTLTCYAHRFSEASETADPLRFAAGDEIRICEVDPADPASPLTWKRTLASSSSTTLVMTATLSSPAWDATKFYRVTFANYTAVQTSQKTKCFQADDLDGLIEDVAAAYEYSIFPGGQSSTAYTAAVATELPARHANVSFGDGTALDTGNEYDIATMCNNLVGYKTAVQTPYVCSEEKTFGLSAGGRGTYHAVEVAPFNVGAGLLSSLSKTRKLYVAPRFKVSTGTGHVRITLLSIGPADGTNTTNGLDDLTRFNPYREVTFSTTSTTFVVATTQSLDIRHLPLSLGLAYLLIEVDENTTYAGLSVCYVGALEAA